ncbi:MAG: hypothetical protein WC476_03835 [Phycisphaerae bacterium]|jgi:hypothetical protein
MNNEPSKTNPKQTQNKPKTNPKQTQSNPIFVPLRIEEFGQRLPKLTLLIWWKLIVASFEFGGRILMKLGRK